VTPTKHDHTTMKRSHVAAALGLACTLAASAVAFGPFDAAAPVEPPLRLVERVPFELALPEVQDHRSERPLFTSGDLVVLEAVDLDLVPTQMQGPVLLCGAEPIQRLNRASSGYLVGIVPHCDDARGDGEPGAGPYHFGRAVLPEQLALADARADLAGAIARGLAPLGEAELQAVTLGTQYFANSNELVIFAADLIERYAYDESDTVRGLRGE